jgi:putative membrane protein
MWGPGYGWGMGGGMGLGFIFWLLILAGLVAVATWFVRGMPQGRGGGRSPGLDALEERYAKGEIGREEYLQKKRDLTS